MVQCWSYSIPIVWLSELGLRSGAGAAVRFFLNQHSAVLVIPEVVRLEVEHNLRSRLREHIAQIDSNYTQLLTAFGKLREVVLPSDQEVEAKIQEVLSTMGVQVLEVPFSLQSARSSLIKTMEKRPPNDRFA